MWKRKKRKEREEHEKKFYVTSDTLWEVQIIIIAVIGVAKPSELKFELKFYPPYNIPTSWKASLITTVAESPGTHNSSACKRVSIWKCHFASKLSIVIICWIWILIKKSFWPSSLFYFHFYRYHQSLLTLILRLYSRAFFKTTL